MTIRMIVMLIMIVMIITTVTKVIIDNSDIDSSNSTLKPPPKQHKTDATLQRPTPSIEVSFRLVHHCQVYRTSLLWLRWFCGFLAAKILRKKKVWIYKNVYPIERILDVFYGFLYAGFRLPCHRNLRRASPLDPFFRWVSSTCSCDVDTGDIHHKSCYSLGVLLNMAILGIYSFSFWVFPVIVHPQNPEPNLRCCMVLSLGSAFHQRYVFLSNRDVLGEGRPLISMSFFVGVAHGLFFFEHVSIPEINPEVNWYWYKW